MNLNCMISCIFQLSFNSLVRNGRWVFQITSFLFELTGVWVWHSRCQRNSFEYFSFFFDFIENIRVSSFTERYHQETSDHFDKNHIIAKKYGESKLLDSFHLIDLFSFGFWTSVFFRLSDSAKLVLTPFCLMGTRTQKWKLLRNLIQNWIRGWHE